MNVHVSDARLRASDLRMSAPLEPRNDAAFRRANRLIILALLCAALVPYLASLSFGYVMDDTTAIRSNPDMNGWRSLLTVWTHPYGGEGSPFFGLYRPLTMAMFAFVWNAGGHWALWFHVLAVLLHAVATRLVYQMLTRISARIPAFLGALWFAVHPVHVEAVANVANSSEVLVALWTCLLALLLARASERSVEMTWRAAAGAGALYLAAFLSKESGAVAPVLALLWVWMRGGDVWRLKRAGIAFLAAALVVNVARVAVLGGPVSGEPIGTPGIAELSTFERVRAMLALGPRIAALLIWPRTLNPHYGPTVFPSNVALLSVVTLTAGLLVVALAAWRARAGDRRWLGGVAWIAVAFLPASNLFVATGQILAERTLYVASIGIAILVAATLDLVQVRAMRATRWPGLAFVGAAAVGALAIVGAFRTRAFVEIWRDHRTLFAQIVAADSMNYRGYWLSGLEARASGSPENALALLGKAHRMYPTDRGLMIDYAQSLMGAGEPAAAATVAAGLLESPRHRTRPYAVALYLEALNEAFGPDSVVVAASDLMREAPSATAALLLGRAFEARGMRDSAVTAYQRGLAVAPGDSALQLRLQVLRAGR
jgi:protein O-mannosyl-transferase